MSFSRRHLDDETPWCAVFINYVLQQAGLPYSSSARARDFLTYGAIAPTPLPGDLVVFWRGSVTKGSGHVGIYLGHSPDGASIHCLGGNQSDGVTVSAFDRKRVLMYRGVG